MSKKRIEERIAETAPSRCEFAGSLRRRARDGGRRLRRRASSSGSNPEQRAAHPSKLASSTSSS